MRLLTNHPFLSRLLAALAIQASLHQHLVTVTAGEQVLAHDLAFGQLTRYRVANPGTWTFRATGSSEHTSQTIKLVPNCIHTIVILDDPRAI
jgi:hypothetical protein